MCQRDDSRGREVAFYVHVTWRDPARALEGGTHEGIRTRCDVAIIIGAREAGRANVGGISRSFFPENTRMPLA